MYCRQGELDAIVTETKNLQKRKRELTEAKLAAQEVIELNNYQSEYPVREQQLKHCQTKATPILQNLAAVREPNLANSFGEVKNGTEHEMAAAGEALRRAADVMQGLTRQLELEEKRLAFLATGKQEGRRIDMIQQQAVEAAYSALGMDAVAAATKNANGEVPGGETPQLMNGGPLIVPKITNEIQCSAPPMPGQSTIAPKDCLTLLDTLSATLANREDNPLQEKYKELQSYQADPNLSKEAYNEQAVAADNKLYQDTHAKATRTGAILAALKAQVLYQTECENWFQMATDSLDWMNEMQAKVDDTFDWRVTLRRFGVDVKPNQRTTVEMADGGPKGTGGMSKRLARHKQLAVDVSSRIHTLPN
ncbi:unnamed protein product [Dibothriocephalus latus]|uniref:Uncharacterized protein n=1 Tax=Dibothriocephalus latus TaxID=60516 RepID=A0A3P7L191_DIBLA|nr:unnamed protein product [Dibothriocephalus latus]